MFSNHGRRLVIAEVVAVAALRSRLLRVARVQQLVDRRIGADRRGAGRIHGRSRLVDAAVVVVVAARKSGRGNGHESGGGKNDLFHLSTPEFPDPTEATGKPVVG